MDYERGLKALKEKARDAQWQSELLTLEARLRENLSQKRRYGDTETRRADRAQIVDALNQLALETAGVSFTELCEEMLPEKYYGLELETRPKAMPLLFSLERYLERLQSQVLSALLISRFA
jgi:hypothetical protein